MPFDWHRLASLWRGTILITQGIVTRCPIELRLIQDASLEQPVITFEDEPTTYTDPGAVRAEIQRKVERKYGTRRDLHEDPLCLEIRGRGFPNFTIVDTPGLTSPVGSAMEFYGTQSKWVLEK